MDALRQSATPVCLAVYIENASLWELSEQCQNYRQALRYRYYRYSERPASAVVTSTAYLDMPDADMDYPASLKVNIGMDVRSEGGERRSRRGTRPLPRLAIGSADHCGVLPREISHG